MPKVTLELSPKRVKELVFQLPPNEFMSLASEVTERAETMAMMQVAESGFAEWNEPGEDIYDETTTR
mgnify:FL=1|jgi:hypothetical protein